MIVPYDRAGERPRAVSERVRMNPLAEAVARESGHALRYERQVSCEQARKKLETAAPRGHLCCGCNQD